MADEWGDTGDWGEDTGDWDAPGGGDWASAGGVDTVDVELTLEEQIDNHWCEAEDFAFEGNTSLALDAYEKFIAKAKEYLQSNSNSGISQKLSLINERTTALKLRAGNWTEGMPQFDALLDQWKDAKFSGDSQKKLEKILRSCDVKHSNTGTLFTKSLAAIKNAAPSQFRKSLIFDIRILHCQLAIGQEEWSQALALTKQIPCSDDNDKITRTALQLTAYKGMNDTASFNKLLPIAAKLLENSSKSDRKSRSSAGCDDQSMGTIRAAIGLQKFAAEDYKSSFKHLLKGCRLLSDAGCSEEAIKVLKPVVMCQVLLNKKSPFYNKEIQLLADRKSASLAKNLSEAWETCVPHVWRRFLSENEQALKADNVFGPLFAKLSSLEPHADLYEIGIYRQVDPNLASGMNCSICLDEFGTAPVTMEDETGGAGIVFGRPMRLFKCADHYFHKDCIIDWIKTEPRCPVCNMYYGTNHGAQPDGTLRTNRIRKKLPGENCATIQVKYEFSAGTQSSDHPNPGQPYTALSGTAYIPDSKDGRDVVKMMEICFDRRIMFEVGNDGTIVPSKHIELKASMKKAWPDGTYCDRMKETFHDKGVTL